jgi:hypothetical protein
MLCQHKKNATLWQGYDATREYCLGVHWRSPIQTKILQLNRVARAFHLYQQLRRSYDIIDDEAYPEEDRTFRLRLFSQLGKDNVRCRGEEGLELEQVRL